MTSLPWPSPPADRREPSEQVAVSADWLRLARLARVLSWLTLAWMGIEGGVAIGAAIVAASVALLGFGLDSGIEAMASVIVIWRFTGDQAGQRDLRAACPAARHSQLLPPGPLHRVRGHPRPGGR